MIPCFLVTFVFVAYALSTTPQLAHSACDEVLGFLSHRWFRRLLDCRKYAHDALRFDTSSFKYHAVRGAGEAFSVYCPRSSADAMVYAWEYNRFGNGKQMTDQSGEGVVYYGCPNAQCCDVLRELIRTNTLFLILFGVLTLLALAACFFGTQTSAYGTTAFGRISLRFYVRESKSMTPRYYPDQ